jgi:hypothetical protein
VTLLVGLGLAGSALAGSRTPSSTSWVSNIWQNPTGSIICRQAQWTNFIICTSQRSGLSVKLGKDGPDPFDIGPARLVRVWAVRAPPGRYLPVAEYGIPWTSDEYRCVPHTTGVDCRVQKGLRDMMGNHGFFLNRRHTRRW